MLRRDNQIITLEAKNEVTGEVEELTIPELGPKNWTTKWGKLGASRRMRPALIKTRSAA